ncbi:MAG: phosphate regulon sensor histidine kinase PhoR [Burkholderiaceae bacterium]
MVWFKSLFFLAVSLTLAGVIALFSPLGAVLVLSFAMIAIVVMQTIHTQRLYDWLLAPQARSVPEGSGLWGEMFDRISRFMRDEAVAREELTDEIEQIRESVDRLPDALIVLNDQNVVQWCNLAAEKLLGNTGSRRAITQFIRQPEFARYLSTGAFEAPLEIELSATPGRIFEIRVHETEDDKRLLISRDITEQAMLNQMRSDFVANVSHEIRTPVTVIGGFAETMLDIELEPAKQREYLDTIARNSHTMKRLVEDLLTLSSLEAADMQGLDESIDLNLLFVTLAGEARDLSNGKHDIRCEPPAPGLRIIGRASEIESAIRNFLTNAVRYTPEQGTVSLEWSQKENADGWITVRDNGIGISREDLPRLSERFYRVDRGRSRATGGTGLGLAIVKRIANRHNARLNVESELGTGSAFSLVLPGSRINRADKPA